MAVDFAGDPLAELTHYQQLGVDGVFVDCPSTAKEWLLATGQRNAGPISWAGTIVSGPGKLSPFHVFKHAWPHPWLQAASLITSAWRGKAHPIHTCLLMQHLQGVFLW